MSRIFKALERAETGRQAQSGPRVQPAPEAKPDANTGAVPAPAAPAAVEVSVAPAVSPAAEAGGRPPAAPSVTAGPVVAPPLPVPSVRDTPAPERARVRVELPEADEVEIYPSTEHERLKIMLTLAAARSDMKSVMLVSSLRSEGVSTVALGLATEMAEGASQGILLIEAHNGSPWLGDALHVNTERGLSDLLAKEVQRSDAIVASPVPRLFFLARGEVSADFSQPRWVALFEELLTDLRSTFDYVIVDAGSLEASPDTLLLSRCVEGVVLVIDANDTPQTRARQTTAMLRRAGANMLGVVLNRRRQYVPKFLAKRL